MAQFRRFAWFDASKTEPHIPLGYYTDEVHRPEQMPPANELHELTEDQWLARQGREHYYPGHQVLGAPPPPTREQQIVGAVRALQATLAAKEAAGIVWQGRRVPTDAAARGRYAEGQYLFVDATGAPHIVGIAGVDDIRRQVDAYVQACVVRYAELYAIVLNDPTTDIKSGWPE